MTKSHILICNEERCPQASAGLRLLGGLLLGLALGGGAFAQTTEARITTLLPSSIECEEFESRSVGRKPLTEFLVSDKVDAGAKTFCYLEFSTEAIPGDAKITNAVLRLVQAGPQPPLDHLINVASIPKGDPTTNLSIYADNTKEFFLDVIRSSDAGEGNIDRLDYPVPDNSRSLLRKEANKKYIALLLSPRSTQSSRNYYRETPDTTVTASNQPRLILTYTVPRTENSRRLAWQSDGWAAMRSSRAFIPAPNVPTQAKYTTEPVIDGTISSYTAAIYGGLTYVVRKYPDKTNNSFDWCLDAQGPLGNVVSSRLLPTALPDQKVRMAVNDSGRLTIVSSKRFIVYQLNTPDANTRPPEPRCGGARQDPASRLKDESVPFVTTPVALLPAPDGSLYVIDDTDLYALNPDLKMLWRTGIGTSKDARMTLGPDGQFIYATGLLPDGSNKKPTLLAINAQTGKTTGMDLPSETKAFQRPVVIKHPDGADYIYVAANSQNSGVLWTLINVPTEVVGDRIARLSRVMEERGLFSQPAADSAAPPQKGDLASKKLYVVWQEKQSGPVRLVSINGQSGAIEKRDTELQLAVAGASELWSGGNLAMDASGNVFFVEQRTLYGYRSGVKLEFASLVDGLPEKLELLFGSEGTLYAQNSQNGALTALIPSYHLPGTVSSISSPTHLRVDGTAGENKEWVLSAPGSVILGNGFTVQKDATLTARGSVILSNGFTVQRGGILTVNRP
jgi:hypothetical protein